MCLYWIWYFAICDYWDWSCFGPFTGEIVLWMKAQGSRGEPECVWPGFPSCGVDSFSFLEIFCRCLGHIITTLRTTSRYARYYGCCRGHRRRETGGLISLCVYVWSDLYRDTRILEMTILAVFREDLALVVFTFSLLTILPLLVRIWAEVSLLPIIWALLLQISYMVTYYPWSSSKSLSEHLHHISSSILHK